MQENRKFLKRKIFLSFIHVRKHCVELLMLKTYIKGVNQGIQQKLQHLKTWNEINTAYSKTYRAAINKHLWKQLGIICSSLSLFSPLSFHLSFDLILLCRPGWSWTCSLPVTTFHYAGVTGVNRHTHPYFFFFFKNTFGTRSHSFITIFIVDRKNKNLR